MTPDHVTPTGSSPAALEVEPRGAGSRRSPLLGAACVSVCILLVHLAFSAAAFQYDDLHSIVNNPHIRSLSNAHRFLVRPDMFSEHAGGGMYRPLVLLSHALNYHFGGYEARNFHWLNAAAHALNSGLVVLLFTALGWSRNPALVAGLLFGLLPVNAEVVNYISSRSESLYAMCFLASAISYIQSSHIGPWGRLWWAGSIAAFVGSLLAKEAAVTLPAILLGYELLGPHDRRNTGMREVVRRQWLHWLIAGAYLVLMRGMVLRATLDEPVRGMGSQLATQVKAWVFYLKLLSMPSHLCVEHQFRIGDSLLQLPALASMTLLVSCVALLVTIGGLRRGVLFWLYWPGILLLPTSLVPLNVLVSEHRLYLPSVAFAALVVHLVSQIWRRLPRVSTGLMVALLLVYALLSTQRNAVWGDPGALWGDALTKAPRMPRPHLFMGDWHKQQGDYRRALAEYEMALAVYPEALSPGDRLIIHNNTGATYLAMGRFVEAVREYQTALGIDSTYVKARDALEGLVAVAGSARDERAEQLYKEGLLLLVGGRVHEAVVHLQSSLAVQSWPQTWLSLGMAHERLEQWGAAAQTYRVLAIAGAGTPFAVTARQRLRELGEAE